MPSTTRYQRFSISDRVEHWLLFASFTLLAVTGLVQQHVDWGVYNAIIRFFGGIENTRLIHHISAIVLMFETIYHLGVQGYRFFVLGSRPSILPGKADAVNILQFLKHGLGLSPDRAQEDHFTFAEKLEYWAVIWGTIVMGLTGFILWNPIMTTRLLPGSFVPAAKAAHGKEALLAVLAILIWHLYTVHIRHLNLSMFHGKMTEEEMEDEHPRALADIKAGRVDPWPDRATIRRRRLIFFPIFAVLAAAMVAGVYFFVATETTALATAPAAEQVAVFAPYTATPVPTLAPTPTPVPPTPTPTLAAGETPQAPAADTWQNGIGDLLKTKCGACHNTANPLGGLDVGSYQAVLKGGNSGPSVVPGEPNTSIVFGRQSSGQHPGMLTPEELQRVLAWIEAGAPEQ
jgi:cytochrome b subunit of formate dehydrogenase